jgi:outer membrane usher protein
MVAHSDAQGDALLTGLNPYAINRIGVDPRDYPIDADVGVSSRVVTPPRGAGVVVNLAPAMRHSFVAVIRLENGDFPSVGALADLHNGSPPLIVGRSGEVFLGGITHPVDATIHTGIGACGARIVPPPRMSAPVMRAGPFICRGAASHAL